jgi:hypothetical protein
VPLQLAVPATTVHVIELKENALPLMLQAGVAVAAKDAEKA